MSILTLGSKKKRREISNQRKREWKFPIKEKEKENFQSKRKQKNREGKFPIKGKKEARKFPIKEWEKAKRKERKFHVKKKKRMGESKKRRKLLVKETKRNVQRGLWTGQYLNNTELSPNEQKEGKETTT